MHGIQSYEKGGNMGYKAYYPRHEENRMHNEGDVLTARNHFISMFQSRAEQSRAELGFV